MHIEPGFIHGTKIVIANATLLGVLAYHSKKILKNIPVTLVRTAMAALFFSVFMQSFHLNVGPSELHFVGAMALYLTLGFTPVLYGFALGLLLQGVFFEPTDLIHLSVNSLSLIVPLIAVHYAKGKQLLSQDISRISFKNILSLDMTYYSGVTFMVGFWLLGEGTTTFAAWAQFALSYLAVVAVEPVFTLGAVTLLRRYKENSLVNTCFATENL